MLECLSGHKKSIKQCLQRINLVATPIEPTIRLWIVRMVE